MYPSDKRPRLYASGAAKKRVKKHRLDNTVADTSKIRSFFVTTTAGEDGTFEGNPENSKRDAVDVAQSVPAPEDEAAAEPATAEPTRRLPVVQELYMAVDNPADRVLFQLGTLPNELRTAILHHGICHPKGSFAITSENGNRRMFSEKTLHALSGAMETERQWL